MVCLPCIDVTTQKQNINNKNFSLQPSFVITFKYNNGCYTNICSIVNRVITNYVWCSLPSRISGDCKLSGVGWGTKEYLQPESCRRRGNHSMAVHTQCTFLSSIKQNKTISQGPPTAKSSTYLHLQGCPIDPNHTTTS